MQLPFVASVFTARTAGVPLRRSGPPESPKQIPALSLCRVGRELDEFAALKNVVALDELGARREEAREQEHLGGLPPAADESLGAVADDVRRACSSGARRRAPSAGSCANAPRVTGACQLDDGDVVGVGSGESRVHIPCGAPAGLRGWNVPGVKSAVGAGTGTSWKWTPASGEAASAGLFQLIHSA